MSGSEHSRTMNSHPSPRNLPRARRSCSLALAALVCALAVPAAALAAPSVPEGRRVAATHSLKNTDRHFLEKVAKGSMEEVQISRVAASRTSSPDVRRFAQTMIADHEGVGEQLNALAASRAVTLPAKDPSPTKWEKRDAKNFDKDYIDKMVSDHEELVKLFQKEAKDGEDADTVAFARKHLPKIQEHLQHALDLKRGLKETR